MTNDYATYQSEDDKYHFERKFDRGNAASMIPSLYSDLTDHHRIIDQE